MEKKGGIKPIYDDNVFQNNRQSFCGGSLKGSKMLVVSDSFDDQFVDVLKPYLEREYVEFVMVKYGTEDDLFQKSLEYKYPEGKFEHIINYFGNGVRVDHVKDFYFLLQREILYVTKEQLEYGTICSILIEDEKSDVQTKGGTIACQSLMMGLGDLVPNYNLIQNGIIASRTVPVEKIVETAIFLSGKYGQMLTGEVVEMKGK